MTGFEKVLQRYGTQVTVLADGTEPGRQAMAFLQPIRDRARQETATPLGWRRQERWLYLGEADVSIDVGKQGFIRAEGREFEVYSARRVDLGRESCHWWGILVPREAEA